MRLFSHSLLLMLLLAMLAGAGCDTNLQVATSTLPSEEMPVSEEEPVAGKASKLTQGDCVDPDLSHVAVDVTLTLCNGEQAQGKLSICSEDGATGCVTTDAFKAADMSVVVAGNIKSSAMIAGVAGAFESLAACSADSEINCVTNPDYKAARMTNFTAANIANGMTIAGVLGTGTGESHMDCASDGAVGCVTTATYKAANTSAYLGSDIKSGKTIAGVAGALGNCADGASGCFVQGPTFKAVTSTDLAAGNIKDSVTIGGVAGTYGPACASDGGSACLVDGTTYKAAKLSHFANSDVKSGITIAGVAGSLGNCADGASGCFVQGPTFKAVTSSDLAATNIKDSVTIGGVAGTYGPACTSDGGSACLVDGTTYKAAAMANALNSNIKSGVTIAGVSGNVTPSPANCASDGASACVVEGTNYIAADKTKVVNTNIKSGVSLGGVTGTYGPACASDGAGSCLVDGATYKAALLSGFSGADIETGVTIAGVAGSATLESHANCGSDGASGCIVEGTNYIAADKTKVVDTNIKSGVSLGGVTGNYGPACASDGAGSCLVDGTTYKAAATATAVAGNIKNGVTIAGVTGDYPSSTYPLAGANAGIADLDTTTFNAKIKSSADFEWFDSVGNPYTHAGEPNITAGLLLNGVSIFGAVGTYVPGSLSVSSLTATKGVSKVALSWTRSGGSGVIIVRRTGASVSWSPTHGASYSVGSLDVNHDVVYKGSAATADDTGVVDSITYYYKAFAYNADNAYSAASTEASVLYTDTPVCGGAGDSCYADAAAIAAGAAITPLGKQLEYVATTQGFLIWKEVSGNRTLQADGLDGWQKTLNINGKDFTATDTTTYNQIAGRVCPTNVYVSDSNKFATSRCLYHTALLAAQTLNAAGTSQVTNGSIGLGTWGAQRWYAGNIQTCTNYGMRLPAIFETNTSTTSSADYPAGDGSPVFAQSMGIPSDGTTSTTSNYSSSTYWLGGDSSAFYSSSYNVRCVTP